VNLTKTFRLGDILVTDRFFYQHYGIYAGNGRVIHYATKNSGIGYDARVRETSLKAFAKDGECGIAMFDRTYSGLKQFSPDDVIRRARSRLGENRYNLLFNN